MSCGGIMSGPQGVQGPAGPAGPAGPIGPAGPAGPPGAFTLYWFGGATFATAGAGVLIPFPMNDYRAFAIENAGNTNFAQRGVSPSTNRLHALYVRFSVLAAVLPVDLVSTVRVNGIDSAMVATVLAGAQTGQIELFGAPILIAASPGVQPLVHVRCMTPGNPGVVNISAQFMLLGSAG